MENDIEVSNLSSLDLAFIGDAIFTFFIRKTILKNFCNKYKINDLSKKCSYFVSAKYQSYIIDYLIEKNLLTEEEINIYKLGRNHHSKSRAKNTSIVNYRKATGFESLIGYLYYNDKEKRLIDLSRIIEAIIVSEINNG